MYSKESLLGLSQSCAKRARQGFTREFGSGHTKVDKVLRRRQRETIAAEEARLTNNQQFLDSLLRARTSGDLEQIANALKVLDTKQVLIDSEVNVGYLDVSPKDIFEV